MWEEVHKDFKGKVVKGMFEWKNQGSLDFTDNAVMILFEDDSQMLISVPSDKLKDK